MIQITKKVKISEDKLKDQYIIEGKSVDVIAKDLGVSRSSVSRALRKNQIKLTNEELIFRKIRGFIKRAERIKGSTWEEFYGKERSNTIKEKSSVSRKSLFQDASYKENNKKHMQSLGKHRKGKTETELYGETLAKEKSKKRSKSLQKYYSQNDSKLKGTTFEEVLGPKKAKIRKKQCSDTFKQTIRKNPDVVNISRRTSKPQKRLFTKVRRYYPDAILEHPIATKDSLRFADIFVPSLKLVIEYDGAHYHTNKDVKRDQSIVEAGYKLLHFHNYVPSFRELKENIDSIVNSDTTVEYQLNGGIR